MSAEHKAELVIMARQPLPGMAKTRLAPVYGDVGAAAIAGFLLRQTVEQATATWPGSVVLAVSPDCRHPLVEQLCRQYALECRPQVEGDLGNKMQQELVRSLVAHEFAVIIGTDSPYALAGVLPLAWQASITEQAIIAPSLDGGYYLLGLRKPRPRLFLGLPWGAASVYAGTMERFRELGMSPLVLPEAQDIDTYEDVEEIVPRFPGLAAFIEQLSVTSKV
ncbi:MAG: TIGR04282 family arsenosugar biosynthesis glycosyltransferase [Gammaproteobacteria bacterium]|nr:TIGR04282 family arsenosugar biosynthesis glycosyltransferase [Gammaproteobacteria bacterium]